MVLVFLYLFTCLTFVNNERKVRVKWYASKIEKRMEVKRESCRSDLD